MTAAAVLDVGHSTSLSLMYTLTVFKTSNLILNLEEEAEYHGLLEVTV